MGGPQKKIKVRDKKKEKKRKKKEKQRKKKKKKRKKEKRKKKRKKRDKGKKKKKKEKKRKGKKGKKAQEREMSLRQARIPLLISAIILIGSVAFWASVSWDSSSIRGEAAAHSSMPADATQPP